MNAVAWRALAPYRWFVGALLYFIGCAACAPPLPPLSPTEGRASVIQLSFAVQVAAELCSVNARHLARFDERRSTALFDACTAALIPARDAVVFVLPGLDPWRPGTEAAVGCAGKAVRVGIERIRQAFVAYGYAGPLPGVVTDGLHIGARLEAHADAQCDPLHPTTNTFVFVDPSIPPVEPDYPPVRSP